LTEEIKCYLYWIRTEEMTDIFVDGYVGISVKPDYRFSQHNNKAKVGKIYNKAFLKALKNGTDIQQIILVGSVNYCKEIENKLRSLFYMGWNVAPGGGSGGLYKHGLTGSKVKGTYYNILTKVKESGAKLCSEWESNDGGLIAFSEFYENNVGLNQCVSITGLDFVGPDTVKIQTQQEVVADSKRSLIFDGGKYTYAEMGEKFNIKPNTLVWRLRRGETLNQALRLEEKPRRTITLSGREYRYNGKLTDDQLIDFKKDVESGIPLYHLRDKFGTDTGNLSRLAVKLGISIPRVFFEDMLGDEFEIFSHSKYDADSYELIKELLLSGLQKYKIAEELGVTPSSITDACKRLKWGEYVEQQRTLG
jgi:hypothetical protein